MLDKTMIITLTTILNHQIGNFYSKDGEYLDYVHGEFNFYQDDIKSNLTISQYTISGVIQRFYRYELCVVSVSDVGSLAGD